MADIHVTCLGNPAVEAISAYHFFLDGSDVGVSALPDFTIHSVVPGAHVIEVAPENVWGLGPKSDPVTTPPAASKCSGVNIQIIINI